jgi:hypothetical protein
MGFLSPWFTLLKKSFNSLEHCPQPPSSLSSGAQVSSSIPSILVRLRLGLLVTVSTIE